jgi:hypothetical protein
MSFGSGNTKHAVHPSKQLIPDASKKIMTCLLSYSEKGAKMVPFSLNYPISKITRRHLLAPKTQDAA